MVRERYAVDGVIHQKIQGLSSRQIAEGIHVLLQTAGILLRRKIQKLCEHIFRIVIPVEADAGGSGVGTPAEIAADKKIHLAGLADRQNSRLLRPRKPSRVIVALPRRVNLRGDARLRIVEPDLACGHKSLHAAGFLLHGLEALPVGDAQHDSRIREHGRIPGENLVCPAGEIHHEDAFRAPAHGKAFLHVKKALPPFRLAAGGIGAHHNPGVSPKLS